MNAFPFNSRIVRGRFSRGNSLYLQSKGERHVDIVQESRAYLRSCCDCCSVLRNAHIARTFGKIRHRGVGWSGTSLLWSLSTSRSTNLPAPLLLSPPLLIAGLRNPRAHRLIKDDPERALEFIAFVSTGVRLITRGPRARRQGSAPTADRGAKAAAGEAVARLASEHRSQ